MSEQITFETSDFASNPEPRCPCILLLDVSGSMNGRPLDELNAGLATFKNELVMDTLAMKRVEVGIVTFGPVKVELPITSASTFFPPTLQAQGDTPMGAAIIQALNMVEDRKHDYRSNGISYYRPWVFLITDGAPTDSWQAAAEAIREGEASKKFAFFSIGVKDANMEILRQISDREPLSLDGLKFRELFSWLSSSLRSVSRSTPGTEVPLEAPKGWGVCVSWRVVGASEVGTSHAYSDTPCQDCCSAQVDFTLTKQPLLSMFVSDGAGSAARGGEGANLAIETAANFVVKKLKQGEFGLNDVLATDLVLNIRERIYSAAETAGLKARDFACTFIGVLSSPLGTLVLQVGDGGVVIDTGTGLEVAVVPMSGEYANMTHFITDDGAVTVLATRTYPDPALRVAVFTDGIQRLALNMANCTPHKPFFAPFFDAMVRATAEQEEQLQGLLVNFLGSQAVNERTDDDKTLTLAAWLP